jgi:hypothetical protein
MGFEMAPSMCRRKVSPLMCGRGLIRSCQSVVFKTVKKDSDPWFLSYAVLALVMKVPTRSLVGGSRLSGFSTL